MLVLAYDTETTGVADFKHKRLYRNQPRPVQIAALLVDTDTWEVKAQMSRIVIPTNNGERIQCSPGSEAIHGITEERIDAEGIPMAQAATEFLELLSQAHMLMGHNEIGFDRLIITAMLADLDQANADQIYEALFNLPSFDTMLEATPIMKEPGGWNGQYKWPKLASCYQRFYGQELVGAHDALADIRATVAVARFMVQNLGVGLRATTTG